MNKVIIRKETEKDYRQTEQMVRRAFWNIHGPGCNEHLMVHKLRKSPDYLPELSRVAELDGKIVGVIMYSVAQVVQKEQVHEVLTFGPLCVEPTLHNLHIGKMLLEETIALAKETKYPGICIFGEPEYYPKHGFVTCDRFGITDWNGNNFDAFMAYPLRESFQAVHGRFREAPVFETLDDEKELAAFDREFPYAKPLTLSCQWLHKERLGRICEVQKNTYTIRFWEKEIPAKLRGAFYKNKNMEFPVVGDYVTFYYNPAGDSVIQTVCERTNLLKRPDQAKTAVDQNMVANVDVVFIVTSLNANYNINRIARYVSISLQADALPVVVLTKADLCDDVAAYVSEVRKLSEKVRVHAVSALYQEGMEALAEYLKPGNTVALIGSSGVGKSTLINVICGADIMRTSAIRASDEEGRHTTTYRRLFELENGVTIIDTPGMREIGMQDVADGISDTFSDVEELAAQCRFRNCRHESEPGCAIRQALQDGTLSAKRYQMYQKLQKENMRNSAATLRKKK